MMLRSTAAHERGGDFASELRVLIAFLQSNAGLRLFRGAYRENMEFKRARYRELAAEAEEDVAHERALIDLKRPDLKHVARIDDDAQNWSIFERIGQGYLDAKERATAFHAIGERATSRLAGTMASPDDPCVASRRLRDELVVALRELSLFASQPHVLSAVVDIVNAFLKNPRLVRSKFLNFMMVGAAGTGKTTLARAIARVFARAGMFVGDRVIDAGRAEFVGEYEGQTVARTRRFLVSNLDRGVIFIDEAYALTSWTDGKLEGYGAEAVTALVEFMSRYKGLYCVMVAGYEREMVRYFLTANPGLPRRLPFRYVLRPLSVDDLVGVFQRHMLLEQGLEVPTGRVRRLASHDYFTDEAWDYLRRLLAAATSGETVCEPEEYDGAVRTSFRDVLCFVPAHPRLHRLFENQAGSMTNLAEEAVTVLMRTVSFREAAAAGAPRAPVAIRTQPVGVMRQIVMRRVVNSTLSEASAFVAELEALGF